MFSVFSVFERLIFMMYVSVAVSMKCKHCDLQLHAVVPRSRSDPRRASVPTA